MTYKVMTDPVTQFVARRKHLCRNAPSCPNCGKKQVQLMPTYVSVNPAEWKCRHCNHQFEYEPKESDDQ